MVHVGIYARISVERDDRPDESIENQILLARAWLERQRGCGAELVEYGCYADKGYSGTAFSRPAFCRMLQDAREGRISCIVCKDASRLGRDHLKTGEYMEKIFPLWGIRLVCISEGYDSKYNLPGSLAGNLRNLMNEWYAKDIGRRVHLVKEQKKRRGEYLGSKAPYGYRLVFRDGRRMLEEDPETILIVREMAAWRQEGMHYPAIRACLQDRGVNPPSIYREQGSVYHCGGPAPGWDCSTIRYVILSYTRGDYHTA